MVDAVRRFLDTIEADDELRRGYESTLWRLALHVGLTTPVAGMTRTAILAFLDVSATEGSTADSLHRTVIVEFGGWCVQAGLTSKSFAWGIRGNHRVR